VTATGQAQKYLLRLMLVDEQLRKSVREAGTVELFLDDQYRGLAEHLLASEDAAGKLPENLINSALDEVSQSLLAGLVMQEDQGWADNPEKIFEDCRRAAANTRLKQRLQEVSHLLEEARHSGDEAAEVQHLREYTEISQKLKKKL
jgi:DNA primase